MNRRLSQFLQAENLTQTQFADTLGVARGSVSNILSGRNKPGFDFMESLLLHYPTLNPDWLITGRGRMYRDAEGEVPLSPVSPTMSSLFEPDVKDAAKQREISKILVFFDDNTYSEFSPQSK